MTAIDPLLFDALAPRYRLERPIGAGGAATVYLAADLKHERQVAVKVLRPELAAAVGAERFLREITTTAQLRHPNILPLFDSGDEGGFLFYVMPFVEGESLRDRLEREAQLPVEEALAIVDEVADALAYAHGRGVVHRDIKPENILLENGHAIVADFGVAGALTAAGDERLTSVGMAVGTPHYMSPEQANGEAVDDRSDQYALGCVAYEMLAGSPPFTGRTAIAVMARHSTDPVPSVATVCPEARGAIASTIERALAKTPAARYRTIMEWRAALDEAVRAPRAATTALPRIHKPPPVSSTPLIGREEAVQAALEVLSGGAQVLSVTGYGGTGKTRFATELFRRIETQYEGGAAFVSLASVTVAAEVAGTIASTLDISEAHGRSAVDALATVFGDRRVLLILDNLEQVLDAAADIAELAGRCPGLQIVATSRAPLKVAAESEFPLPPLELPAAGEHGVQALSECPSVALFAQRAQKVQPGFALTEENAEAVAGICRRLDGLPLALELAAARIRILEPAALLQRLDRALDLLTSGDRDLPMRQRTLRTTISWSYSLLNEDEQRLLRTLSVFHEGWTLESLERVCYAESERFRALDELDSLVEKALIRVVGMGERYALLETIRAFAAEQLHALGEVAAARGAHAAHFVSFATNIDRDIRTERQLDAMQRARTENANTQAAVQWLSGQVRSGDEAAVEQGLLLCGSLCWPWHIWGQHLTARSEVDVFLERADNLPPSRARAMALLTRAMSRGSSGDPGGGVGDAERAHEDGLALGLEEVVAEACIHLGYLAIATGKVPEAEPHLSEAVDRSRGAGADFIHGIALALHGMCIFLMGDLESGLTLVEEAHRIQLRIRDFEGGGLALSFMAQMRFAKGDHAGAVALFREALASFEQVGDRPEIARLHCEMGWAALGAGYPVEASTAFRLAVHVYEEVGSPRGTGAALLGLAAVEAAEGRAERAVAIAGAAHELSSRAGIVMEHPMDPGVVERIEALKASIPSGDLAGIEADARALTPAAVVAMVVNAQEAAG